MRLTRRRNPRLRHRLLVLQRQIWGIHQRAPNDTGNVTIGQGHPIQRHATCAGLTIINSSSRAGLIGTPNLIAYGAAKHAVIGMTKTAAIELAPAGIRVNAVCPGPIDSRMMEAIAAGKNPEDPSIFLNRSAERNPMGRMGKPEEVVALVTFLASDDASYINGSWHSVDGGLAAT